MDPREMEAAIKKLYAIASSGDGTGIPASPEEAAEAMRLRQKMKALLVRGTGTAVSIALSREEVAFMRGVVLRGWFTKQDK